MSTLRRTLLVGLLSGMLVSTLVAGVAAYSKVREAANELFDYQLTLVATNLPARIAAQPEPPDDGDPYNDIVILIWDHEKHLIYPTRPTVAWSAPASDGFSEAPAAGRRWRIFSQHQADRIVEIAQPMEERAHLVTGLLFRAILPFLVLIPVLAALIWVTVGRAVAPLNRLAAAVEKRSAAALQPLPRDGLPGEILPVVQALDNLLVRLGAALTAQRDFIADAAHELRSPLTALKLQLQLAERAKTPEQTAVALSKLDERLARTVRLVEQLLTLAREEPQLDRIPSENLILEDEVRQVASDHATLAEFRHISVKILADNSTRVFAERTNLRVMLSNLLDNAIRFSPANGTVQIRVSHRDGSAALEIVDSGPGIPPEDRERVFDRFYRREGSGVTGSGLGLAIVRTIAHHSGCKVTFEDGDANVGIKAVIKFPRSFMTSRQQDAELVES